MIIALAAVSAVLVVSAAARAGWTKNAALRALKAGDPARREWRLSCAIARLFAPAFLSIVLLLLVGASLGGVLTTDRWAVGLAVVTAVLGNHVDREISGGWTGFWDQCRRSLWSALPTFPTGRHRQHGKSELDCQALQCGAWHSSLLHPGERASALKHIFEASPHPDTEDEEDEEDEEVEPLLGEFYD
jgi:hypothetical protein